MKICIYGLGAIGGLFAARLARAGINVSAIARGATLDAVNRDGLTLIEQADGNERRLRVPVNATPDPATLGEQDLVIVTVKTTALQSVARNIAPLLGANTTVLSAMNGIPWWFFYGLKHDNDTMQLQSIDPTGEISTAIAPERIVGCVTHLAATTPAPGVVNAMAGNRLIIGEPTGEADSVRCAAIIGQFRQAGFEVEQADSIQRDIWFKLWGNMTVNPISAITGATVDRILDDDCVRDFMTRCMVEAARIGKRIGVPIDIDPVSRHEVTRKLGAFKTSMLQDVEAGKPVELDALVGAVLEIAQRVREPAPNIEALFGLARLHAKMRSLY
ncbi:MAG: 2-dehydropantoate 2-reductase [Burkholderiales bacterium]